ncbi:hypothetical protein [Maricaulis sp.]
MGDQMASQDQKADRRATPSVRQGHASAPPQARHAPASTPDFPD